MAQILRPKAVFARSGKSRTATYADQAKGLFPRFFKLGSRAAGMTEEQLRARPLAPIYGTTLALNLVAALSLAMFVGGGDLQFGLFAGFMTGATFVATALGVTFLFEGRPLRLWLIDAGYQTLNFTAMGAILGAWH